ncbi:MAG: hypothetical protein QOH08_2578 [Chloroflexota bacterium]|nr:hypothetical protein [Chloroflexota bacterium]
MKVSIYFVCTADQHHDINAGPRTVTIHHGEWAYCPDGAADGHEWKPIDPIPFQELLLSLKAAHFESLPSAEAV